VADASRVWIRFTRDGERVSQPVDVTTPDLADVVGYDPPSGARPSWYRGPVELTTGEGKTTTAWTEGSPNDGIPPEAIAAHRGGAALLLGFKGAAKGRIAMAVDEAGQGAVAFLESNERETHVVVGGVRCADW
jgi:hypothetical protein